MFWKIVPTLALMIMSTAWVSAARAEISKIATVGCDQAKICFYWWPKLPPLAGWHTDKEANFAYGGNGMNSLVPDGQTFSNADTVIYGFAAYKPRYAVNSPQVKSLSDFIAEDKAVFANTYPGMAIAEAKPLITADGQKLRSFKYFRPADKTWERVSYGEESDYYLVFTISARSEALYNKDMQQYEKLLGLYRQ